MGIKTEDRVVLPGRRIYIGSSAAVVGKTEAEGPMGMYFDECFPDDGVNQKSWEDAESELVYNAITKCIGKAKMKEKDIDLLIAGDLMNQCTASTFGIRGFDIPFAGVFGACSTMAYSLALSALLIDGGAYNNIIAGTSSHFCTAEKQFRTPLEYGGQRSPTTQRTVTGAGMAQVTSSESQVSVESIILGKIKDRGITDAANMGAAMAPVIVIIMTINERRS